MMHYNMYTNPVYLVPMTMAEIKVPTLFITKTHSNIHIRGLLEKYLTVFFYANT